METANKTSKTVNKSLSKLSIPKKAGNDRKKETQKDLELVKRCQKGDESAFRELVQKYQRKVFTVALSMVKNPDDAMDVAQEAFVKVYRYLGNFKEHKIVVHNFIFTAVFQC